MANGNILVTGELESAVVGGYVVNAENVGYTDGNNVTTPLQDVVRSLASASAPPSSNASFNRVVKKLFIDTSGYTGSASLDGLKVGLLARSVGGMWGIQLRNGSNATVESFWMDSELPVQDATVKGMYVHAEYDWPQMGNGQLSGAPFPLNSVVFDSANDPRGSVAGLMIADGAISEEKLSPELAAKINSGGGSGGGSAPAASTPPSSNASFNRVVKKLFIDTSGYTGGFSLDGLKVGILARNSGGSWGIRLVNGTGEVIADFFMDSEKAVQDNETKFASNRRGVYLYAEYDWSQMGGSSLYNITLNSVVFDSANDPRNEGGDGDADIVASPLHGMVYAACGDSITEGAGIPDSAIDASDKYYPIHRTTGTARKSYPYYIAKLNRMKWINDGYSGSTLGDVTANGIYRNGFSTENGRYTRLLEGTSVTGIDVISIFFGWNDAAYGHVMHREDWLREQYGSTIYYPMSSDKIGTSGYATQAQKNAVDAVTGQVGGQTYSTSSEYWSAKYCGTPSDSTNKTYWGAMNIVLDYLIRTFPTAKVLLISPYGSDRFIRQAVRDASVKWGTGLYDFYESGKMLFYDTETPNSTALSVAVNGTTSLKMFRRELLMPDGVHPSDDGYKYLYPSINAKLQAL